MTGTNTILRKILISIIFPPAILGPEMAATILWAPGIFWFFLLETTHAHKIPPFFGGGGGFWVFLEGGGRSVNFILMGAGIFLIYIRWTPSLKQFGFTVSTFAQGPKINANFSVQSFSRTLRVMDVRAETRGRPHQKVHVPAARVMGRNSLTPGHPSMRVRNVCRKLGQKRFCLCGFLP